MISQANLIVLVFCFTFSYYVKSNAIPFDYHNNPEQGDLFEGDIEGIDLKGAARNDSLLRYRWPNGIVPYVIDDEYTQSLRDVILTGLKLIEDLTRVNDQDCIKFVPRTVQPAYIRVYNGSGCSSYVGKIYTSGYQLISLRSPGCITTGIVAHEFMHSLGFWHEQSRSDRDDYIEVFPENITPGAENNFNKYDYPLVDFLGLPYDYDSIMHYPESSFSRNGLPTIKAKDPDAIIGQRKTLSSIDIEEIRRYYSCY